jgi:membrane protein involved in colicin uptake
LTLPDRSSGSGSASTAAAMTKKVVEMRTTKEDTVAKFIEEATMAKVDADKAAAVKAATDKAASEKVAANKVAAMKATEEAMAKAATDAVVMKTTEQRATTMKTIMESVGSGSSPTTTAGSKRAAVSGGSTPPSKWFRYAWKPWYAEQLCSHLLLYIHLYII